MSRLIDKLTQISKGASQAIGFRTHHVGASKTQMLLIACLTGDVDSAGEYVTGADGVLLDSAKSRPATKPPKKLVQSLPADMPWGWLPGDNGAGVTDAAIKEGCDFIVFPATSAVAATSQGNKTGKILQVESSLNESLFRTITELPVDAVLIAPEHPEAAVTWHLLMVCQRFASLVTKPLLVFLTANVTASDLKALWEAGMDGVVVEVGAGQPAKRIEELRREMDSLGSMPPRKRGKIEAFVPYFGEEMGTEPDIDTEEEDE